MTAYLLNPVQSLQNLQSLLNSFGELSGLKINTTKSEIYPIYLSKSEKEDLNPNRPWQGDAG